MEEGASYGALDHPGTLQAVTAWRIGEPPLLPYRGGIPVYYETARGRRRTE